MKCNIKSLFGIAGLVFGLVSNASSLTIWNVSDGSGTCGGHGLWTNGSNCDKFYYSFQAGSTLTEKDDGTAVLDATAKNGNGIIATILLTFDDYTEDHTDITNLKGTSLGDESSWRFYQSVIGTIDIGGIVDQLVSNSNGQTSFQIGDGANDKTGDFGASAWIQGPGISAHHWDLNMDLTAVPEPGSLALLGIGLAALGLSRRRSNN